MGCRYKHVGLEISILGISQKSMLSLSLSLSLTKFTKINEKQITPSHLIKKA
jgi:hypothetical protein